jgi:stearoyl-CoA desaturase (delta-9 desaturase)
MSGLPASLDKHRVRAIDENAALIGTVHYSPVKSLWFLGMAGAGVVGGILTFNWAAFALFLTATAIVLLFGHSLGSHRKLIHNSYQCPKWLEYVLVYLGVLVGLAGPLGLLRQHELRDYAQRLEDCHDYLKHGRSFWVDAWWQLNCELRLANPPDVRIERDLAEDLFYRFLERTWMAQQLPLTILFYLWGDWAFVFWGACARVTAGVFGHWLIGYFAHNHGNTHFYVHGAAVQGKNIPFTSLLTMGECWHNNHHAFPGSARLGLFPGEWDPGWWVLLILRRTGLVRDLRLPADLPDRPELVAINRGSRAFVQPRHALLQSGSEGQAPALLRFSNMARLCVAQNRGSVADRPVIEWPAATLSPRLMKIAVGDAIRTNQNSTTSRLLLRIGTTCLVGLPAFCVAVAQRNVLSRAAALLALPAAIVLERTRSSLAAVSDGR